MVVSGHSQSLQLTGLGKSLPLTCPQQPRLNYKRKVHSANRKGTSEYPAWVIAEVVALDPPGHLYEATLPRQGVIAALPNTKK